MVQKLAVTNGEKFTLSDAVMPNVSNYSNGKNDYIRFIVAHPYEELESVFVNGVQFNLETTITKAKVDEEGTTLTDDDFNILYEDEVIVESYDGYTMVGGLIRMSTTLTAVLVRLKTELEATQEALDTLAMAYLGGE